MKRYLVLALFLGGCLVSFPARRAEACWDDVHYDLTYYVARLVGYTPEQAYRIAAANLGTDYAAATEPSQMTLDEVLARVQDPQPPEKQDPRWRFHAFRNTLKYPDSVGNGPGAAEADGELLFQEWALRLHASAALNPGVYLHFLQDEGSHQGFGSAWGHWFNWDKPQESTQRARDAGLPIGGAVDWLSFARPTAAGPGPKENAIDLVNRTARLLDAYMAEVSPRQKRREWSLLESEQVIDELIAQSPPPTPLAVTELSDYAHYYAHHYVQTNYPARYPLVQGLLPPFPSLTPERAENFRRHADGPDLAKAEQCVNAALGRMGMAEKVVPRSYLQARGQYELRVDTDGFAWPVDSEGRTSAKARDGWVLTGSLTVVLEAGPTTPRETVEVRIKAAATMAKQEEYDLIKPPQPLAVGEARTWDQLPIGDLIVELRRGGELWRRQRVALQQATQTLTVRLDNIEPILLAGDKVGETAIHPERSFTVAGLNDLGQLLFYASDTADRGVLMQYAGGEFTPVLRVGDKVGDVVVGAFTWDYSGLNNNGQSLFGAIAPEGGDQLFHYANGRVTTIVAPGKAAPGGTWTKAAVTPHPWLLSRNSINAGGNAAFSALVDAGGETHLGTFMWNEAAQQALPVALKGMPAPNGMTFGGATFRSGWDDSPCPPPVINNHDEIAFERVLLDATGYDWLGVCFQGRAGDLQPVAVLGQILPPGFFEVQYARILTTFNDAGMVPFWDALFGDLYLWERGSVTGPILFNWEMGPDEATVGYIASAWLNDANKNMLVLTMRPNPDQAALYRFVDGKYLPVALPGQEMPGGGRLAISSWAILQVSTPNSAGQQAFVAWLDDGAMAVYRVDADGRLTFLLKSGMATAAGKVGGLLGMDGLFINNQGTVALDAQIETAAGTRGAILRLWPSAP